jgi:arylsulfatase A
MIGTLPLDGVSLVPLLMERPTDWPERMIFTHLRNRGGVRTQKYRLYVSQKGVSELYDMDADPGENHDISSNREDQTRILRKAYDDWLLDVRKDGFQPISIPVGHPERPETILPGHEAFLAPEQGRGIDYHGSPSHPGTGWANDWIDRWTEIGAFPYWEIDVVNAGKYKVTLMYACEEPDVGAKLRVQVGDRFIDGMVDKPHDPASFPSPDRVKRIEVYEKEWAPLELGEIDLDKGRTRLSVKALSKPGRKVTSLKQVHLERIS